MSAPSSTTSPAIEPVAPLPICSVPALIVVPPEYVLAPVRIVVPAPAWFSVPVPLTTPAYVRELLRLKISALLSVMLPATAPVVPPLPICSVPALIVVPPE